MVVLFYKPFPGFEPGTSALPWQRSTCWAKTATYIILLYKKTNPMWLGSLIFLIIITVSNRIFHDYVVNCF